MEKLSIKTNRLHIRHLSPKDLSNFHAYRCLPEVALYQGYSIMNEKECEAFIEKYKKKPFGLPGEWLQYGLANKTNDELIGDCAVRLLSPDPRIAEIGISISPKFQKKGFAKEAMVGLMKWLFDVKEVHRIVEITDAENEGAIQLLKSLGFREEGHFVENIWFNEKWGSEYQYAMLRKEWKHLNDK